MTFVHMLNMNFRMQASPAGLGPDEKERAGGTKKERERKNKKQNGDCEVDEVQTGDEEKGAGGYS